MTGERALGVGRPGCAPPPSPMRLHALADPPRHPLRRHDRPRAGHPRRAAATTPTERARPRGRRVRDGTAWVAGTRPAMTGGRGSGVRDAPHRHRRCAFMPAPTHHSSPTDPPRHPLRRHDRPCAGHPRRAAATTPMERARPRGRRVRDGSAWVAGTRPAMTGAGRRASGMRPTAIADASSRPRRPTTPPPPIHLRPLRSTSAPSAVMTGLVPVTHAGPPPRRRRRGPGRAAAGCATARRGWPAQGRP